MASKYTDDNIKHQGDLTGVGASLLNVVVGKTDVFAHAAEMAALEAGDANSAVIRLRDRLNELANSAGGGGGGNEHASGLDYVPYDGYLASLHRGETVLNRAEAAAYRFKGGSGVAAIDYGALASAMSGMTVQMDGRVVGRLVERSVSTAQGERYGRAARNY